jgi:predicted RNase H-like nuclease
VAENSTGRLLVGSVVGSSWSENPVEPLCVVVPVSGDVWRIVAAEADGAKVIVAAMMREMTPANAVALLVNSPTLMQAT